MDGPTAPFWIALAYPGAPFTLIGVLMIVVWWKRAWRVAFVMLAAVCLTDASNNFLIKPAFAHERPCRSDATITAKLEAAGLRCGPDFAFPSSHAANTAALAAASASAPLAAVSAIVGVGRVILGVHAPEDVGAGWLYGAVVGAAVRAFANRSTRWK